MRVSCLQENLAKGLSIVSRAVSSRSTLPVLGNILLEAKDNQLRLSATNLEIGIHCWIGAKVEDEGATTIPAKLLGDFVNSLPPERIDMNLEVRTQSLHLQCAKYDANIKGIDASEFPIIPTADSDGESGADLLEGSHIALETDGLRKMIDQVVFAAATNESRPTLTGVEVSIKPDRLAMAATDGFRLSVRSVMLENELGENLTVIVPAKSLGELGRISAEADGERPVDMTVTQARNQILFRVHGKPDTKGSFQRVDLVSQLIDARFPDYQAIIPKSYDTRTVVDTAGLLKAVRVANLFAGTNNIIRVVIDPGNGDGPGSITLQAKSAEMGDSVNTLDAMVEGESLEIAFNGRYLIDVLSQMDQSQVVLETTLSTRPGSMRPVGLGPDEFLHVVMPMHMPNN